MTIKAQNGRPPLSSFEEELFVDGVWLPVSLSLSMLPVRGLGGGLGKEVGSGAVGWTAEAAVVVDGVYVGEGGAIETRPIRTHACQHDASMRDTTALRHCGGGSKRTNVGLNNVEVRK